MVCLCWIEWIEFHIPSIAAACHYTYTPTLLLAVSSSLKSNGAQEDPSLVYDSAQVVRYLYYGMLFYTFV